MESKAFGSSDLGNVGNEHPTVNINFPIGSDLAPHTKEFLAAACSDEGFDGAFIAGKVVALSALELLNSPDKVGSIKAVFDQAKADLD